MATIKLEGQNQFPAGINLPPIESSPIDPLSVPGLLLEIHAIKARLSESEHNPTFSIGEQKLIKDELIIEKAQRVFLLLGKRDNPEYKMEVTLFRQDEDEVHQRSSHRFNIDVFNNQGVRIGTTGSTLATLTKLPYFNDDSKKALYELVKPDTILPEPPNLFARRMHEEIRSIEKEYSLARRYGNIDEMYTLDQDRNRLIDIISRARIKNPKIKKEIEAVLNMGTHELMIGFYFRNISINPEDNYVKFPWTQARDQLIKESGDYDYISDDIIDQEDTEAF